MSGFERAKQGAAWTDAEEFPFPDDFTADEADFASELRTFYALERDEPPPLYAQTLLGHERPAAAEPGFEQHVLYAVFQRLNLPRPRLFAREAPKAMLRAASRVLRESLAAVPRSVGAGMAAALIFMVLTVTLASPSFAAGLRILLGHTGVQQVTSYPGSIRSSRNHAQDSAPKVAPMTGDTALYWLGERFGDYAFYSAQQLAQQDWAQGPMVDLRYVSATPGGMMTDMPAVLDIREFRLTDQWSTILQVVQAGYATELSIGMDQAVYVDGKWVHYSNRAHISNLPEWQAGQKSELIIEHDGIIFWITGDQTQGADQTLLASAARQLTLAKLAAMTPHPVMSRWVGQEMQAALADPGDGEVYALVSAGQSPDSGAAALVTDASDSPGD
jgi:hypothetical protein